MRTAIPSRRRAPRGTVLALLTFVLVPVWMGCAAASRTTAGTRPPAPKPLTFAALFGPQAANFHGQYPGGLKWAPFGQRYLQRSRDGLQQVD
ncbi:MAG: hypothetical protein AB1716_11870, partial [Planctomycetota bacterium]